MASGQGWSVIINGKPAAFDPDVFGTDPGQPLKAQIGDLVCWNNQTAQDHQLAVTDGTGKITFTTEVIKAGASSFPGYVTTSSDSKDGTIAYHCIVPKHEGENGQITVVTS
jgi:plastocyanin